MTKEDLIKRVNASLSGFLWGGHVVDMHRNAWDEWIADCIVYNPDYRDNTAISAPKPREWQYMVHVENLYGKTYVTLYRAHDDKRDMTFTEECGLYDERAPRSPYIDAVVVRDVANPF